MKCPVPAAWLIGRAVSFPARPSAPVRYRSVSSLIAAGSLASTSTSSAFFGSASSRTALITLIVGGRVAEKHEFFFPGVPAGRGAFVGSADAAQFSAISPEAEGEMRSREAEYPSALTGQG